MSTSALGRTASPDRPAPPNGSGLRVASARLVSALSSVYRGVMSNGAEDYDHDALRTFFVQHSLALGAGDLEAVAERFDPHALVVLAEESVPLTTPEQVHDVVREHGTPGEHGAVAVVPEVTDVAELG